MSRLFLDEPLRAYLDYHFLSFDLNYWRSTSKMECIGIEVKTSKTPSIRDYNGLLSLEEDVKFVKKIIVCQSEMKRKTKEGIIIYPIIEFLEDLWGGKVID